MEKRIFLLVVFLLLLTGASYGAALSEQYQQDLIDQLNFVRGVGPHPASMDSVGALPHCGTTIGFQLFINRENFTGQNKIAAAQAVARPILPDSLASPASHFLIHYDHTNVYQPGIDTIGGGDGVPDFINKVADIADSVWWFEITHLGYPAPPKDNGYPSGGDSLYDIYIRDLGTKYYGQTQGDEGVDNQRATSFMEIDNDYNFFPYSNRPLDAVRVTVAHEYFHAVHFGMDYTEYDGTTLEPRLYWWEMSATWMEEMAYDGINDYYDYLPVFFDYPWVSLQDFTMSYPLQLHPYGAAVFPIFLTEKWDTVIVKNIWQKCRDYGVGPQFLRAADDAIYDISGNSYRLRDAMQEFSIWNLFTGSRASRAPAGYKYSEASNYPVIPDSAFFIRDHYPDTMIYGSPRADSTWQAHVPQNVASNYLELRAISLIPDTMVFRFAGDNSADKYWNLSFVGFPINPGQVAVVQKRAQVAGGLFDTIPSSVYGNWNRMYVIPTVTSIHQDAYPGSKHYTYIIFDSAAADTSKYQLLPPFPNPMKVNSSEDFITFRVQRPVLPTQQAIFNITIFDIAGEKVKELTANEGYEYLLAEWKLDNGRGEKVAPGVYLAFCRLHFSDGTPEVTRKYKLAIIK
ncbi:MAG: hypothetical protein NT002_02670 [candidate division Zixibacteria bacterium]|nr:hypothetical protein [candidate division Zixibacteria bacterium]